MRCATRDASGVLRGFFLGAALLCLGVLGAGDALAAQHKKRTPKKALSPEAVFRARVRRAIKRQCGHPENLGVYVRSVSTAQTLFSHRFAAKRIPASNVKLFTAAAALARLGPDYRFATDFYARAEVREGVLAGDLYLKGYGDPLFVQEKMRDLVRRLALRGVRRIAGDLVADDTFFDRKKHGRGWRVGRSIRPYTAPHGALSLNFSLVSVLVAPGGRVGSRARVQLEPPSRAVRLAARAKTSRGGRLRIHLGRKHEKGVDVVQVGGSIPSGAQMQAYRVPVTDPTAFTAGAVAAEFAREGIAFAGKIRRGRTPPDARLVVRNLSPPLAEVIRGLNKFSNNFVAEQILKTLGAEVYGAPGTAEKGLRAVREFSLSAGVPAAEFELADGSGLSRLNRASPRALVALLEATHNDFRLRPEFVASLAVFGVDGTLWKRRRAERAAHRVRMKTGLLNGVRTFSGYAAAGSGEILAFSLLINENACRPKSLSNALVRAMVSFRRDLPPPVRAGLRAARRMMGRPMPKPHERDRWHRENAPRPLADEETLAPEAASAGGGQRR